VDTTLHLYAPARKFSYQLGALGSLAVFFAIVCVFYKSVNTVDNKKPQNCQTVGGGSICLIDPICLIISSAAACRISDKTVGLCIDFFFDLFSV